MNNKQVIDEPELSHLVKACKPKPIGNSAKAPQKYKVRRNPKLNNCGINPFNQKDFFFFFVFHLTKRLKIANKLIAFGINALHVEAQMIYNILWLPVWQFAFPLLNISPLLQYNISFNSFIK